MKEILRNLRVESGLTQKELSLQIGSTDKSIWNYEKGLASPPYEILIAYSKYFDVSTDYLLGLEDDFGARVPATPSSTVATSGAPLTTEESKVLEQYRNLPEQLRKLIRQQLDVYNSSEELLFKPDKKV